MFNKYSHTVAPIVKANTLEEIVTLGKAASAKCDEIGRDQLQYTGREFNFFMNEAIGQLKILRCAWYAKRYGWVK